MEVSKTNYRRDVIDDKFQKMCNEYYSSSEDKETGKPRQFAVMWIGEEDYSGKAKGFKTTSQKGLLDQGDFYIAARYAGNEDYVEEKPTDPDAEGDEPNPKKKIKLNPKMKFDNVNKHTEVVILDNIEEHLKKYKEKNPTTKPNLYLFSLQSPCCGSPPSKTCPKGCSGELRKWFGENKGLVDKMTIAWSTNYCPRTFWTDGPFLYGLFCILTEDGMEIKWNEDNDYCEGKKRDWFQRNLFKCIKNKKEKEDAEKIEPPLYGCTTRADFNRDIATLINRITWQCGTRNKDVINLEMKDNTRPSNDPDCWKKPLDKILEKTGVDFTDLKKIIPYCLEENRTVMVGPALDPQDPTKHSNKAKDVEGDPAADLCFQK